MIEEGGEGDGLSAEVGERSIRSSSLLFVMVSCVLLPELYLDELKLVANGTVLISPVPIPFILVPAPLSLPLLGLVTDPAPTPDAVPVSIAFVTPVLFTLPLLDLVTNPLPAPESVAISLTWPLACAIDAFDLLALGGLGMTIFGSLLAIGAGVVPFSFPDKGNGLSKSKYKPIDEKAKDTLPLFHRKEATVDLFPFCIYLPLNSNLGLPPKRLRHQSQSSSAVPDCKSRPGNVFHNSKSLRINEYTC